MQHTAHSMFKKLVTNYTFIDTKKERTPLHQQWIYSFVKNSLSATKRMKIYVKEYVRSNKMSGDYEYLIVF